MSPRLLVALTLTTAAAWRFPGLARPREEDVIEHEVTPTGPRELTIETHAHDYEAHESTMVLPCVEIKILRRVRAESSRRPPRHRRNACLMASRCRFLAARPSQDGDDEHPTHWLISTQVLPFEDTHACLLQSLKDYLDTHGEEFESKIMLKIGLSRRR